MKNKNHRSTSGSGEAILISIAIVGGSYLIKRLIDYLWSDPKEKERHKNRTKEEEQRHKNRCDEDEHRHEMRMEEIHMRQQDSRSKSSEEEEPLREEKTFSSAVNGDESTKTELLAGLFRPGERVVLFSRTGQGKSTLVTQMAILIAVGLKSPLIPCDNANHKPQDVCLYDAEQEEDDMHDRYGSHGFTYPKRLRRIDDCYFESSQALGSDIERRAKELSMDTVIILDNITAICPSFVAEKARDFFRILRDVQIKARERGIIITFILVGHTTKDYSSGPIELAHLAGSANIVNFATTVLALSATRFGETPKMLKILKSRKRPKDGMVSILKVKDNPFLHFEFQQEASESDALPEKVKPNSSRSTFEAVTPEPEKPDKVDWKDKVEMHRLNKEEGKSYRYLSKIYNVSHKTVGEYIKEVETKTSNLQ